MNFVYPFMYNHYNVLISPAHLLFNKLKSSSLRLYPFKCTERWKLWIACCQCCRTLPVYFGLLLVVSFSRHQQMPITLFSRHLCCYNNNRLSWQQTQVNIKQAPYCWTQTLKWRAVVVVFIFMNLAATFHRRTQNFHNYTDYLFLLSVNHLSYCRLLL